MSPFSLTLEGLGIEALLDQVESALRSNLNDQIDAQNDYWAPIDEARALSRGVDYEPIVADHVSDSAFFVLNIPTLTQKNFDMIANIPYVAIVPDDTAPDAEDARTDQRNVYQNQISIHAIARTLTPDEDPELAGRRAVRTAEAIFKAVYADSGLKRMLKPLSNPVRVRVSEPFAFNVKGHGKSTDYYWQAAGVQYAVKNYTTVP